VNSEAEAKAKRNDNLRPERANCPSCGSKSLDPFHRIESIPVNSVLNIRSREEALSFPRDVLALSFCRGCGFIFNSMFDPDKVRYSSECEESQGYSPTFNRFARDLALHFVEKYSLKGKKVVEIGCGKGEFLKLICSLTGGPGVGFDPAFVPGRGGESSQSDRIEFISDYYSEKYAHYLGDMICCRMTLEHIPETAQLVQSLRRSIGPRGDTIVFFQVPDVTRIIRSCAFEDIYYEHCSYFSPGSLARLFRSCGFDILDLKLVYGEQYILIEARPASEKLFKLMDMEKDHGRLDDLVHQFGKQYTEVLGYWDKTLAEIGKNARRAVIWGSGSKGVTFLNVFKYSSKIAYVVDINPHRQGTYMAGTGEEIVAPDFLRRYRPDAVIIMNPVYREEIASDLKKMGLAPAIHALGEHVQGIVRR
jgi:2-polyprenyl-3-methyl-5-hydroxy-6-metoxy-1,4-benzoquinol methylase